VVVGTPASNASQRFVCRPDLPQENCDLLPSLQRAGFFLLKTLDLPQDASLHTITKSIEAVISSEHGRNCLNSLQNLFGRHAHGFKPAADINLSVGLATEMPGGGACGGGQIPLDDRKLPIGALDHKPMDRILTDDPANFALEFLQTRHAFSIEQWLGKPV
jgi:hypothetical protein